MVKLWSAAIIMVLFTACRQQDKTAPVTAAVNHVLQMDTLPQRIAINPKAGSILKAWPEFNNLESNFDALYRAENREDLILIVEDFVENQKVMEASEYPEEFDKPQIKSRQKVLKTYILKTKAALEYRTDVLPALAEMLVAYNALRTQFNVTVNNTLDTRLILEQQ
ncbi:MAG TPA: hypothetical protein VKN36_04255 [Eudoraea sp.]|nr:hypothetical protein [Eudoraea sp.]